MAETGMAEQEIAELRDEIRKLREETEKQNHQNGDGRGIAEEQSKPQENDYQNKDDQAKEKPEQKSHLVRNIIIVAAAVVLVVAGVVWWLHSRQFENTDDATVDGHTNGLSSRIAGTVVGAYLEENQFVKAGEVVADLDPRDYKLALEQAQAQLKQAQNQVLSEQPSVPVTQVTNATDIATANAAVNSAEAGVAAAERNYEAAREKIEEARANSLKAQADVERYRPLVARDEVPREQFDQVVANATALAATVAANQAAAQAAQRQIDQARAQLAQTQEQARAAEANAPHQIAIRRANVSSRQAAVIAAQAQVDQAQLNLSYCKITSPVNGAVAKRTAEVGQHLAPGEQVYLIAQIDDLWVTANFRETQLRRMHAGQSARIHVDALAADFDGYVESMPAASGSITSLLPPENATGNFVKVVQRLPVRIRFKKNQPGMERLRPGMSVEPTVTVG